MSYSVKDRLPYIGRRVTEVRGEYITYQRKDCAIVLLMAPGHTDVQDMIPETVVTQLRYVDFLITRKELVLPRYGLTLPERNDRIFWNGDEYVVTPPAISDDVYQFTTMYRDRLRVHTLFTTVSTITE
jgi:hypothetical protein